MTAAVQRSGSQHQIAVQTERNGYIMCPAAALCQSVPSVNIHRAITTTSGRDSTPWTPRRQWGGGRVIDGDQQKMTTPAISAQTANRHPNHTQPRWRLRVAQ